jgi:glyoxylase-like metal-dependent hydrolase (beta-lactamase superfamily II)
MKSFLWQSMTNLQQRKRVCRPLCQAYLDSGSTAAEEKTMDEVYHFRIGDFACTSVFDQNDTGPAELVFANAPDEELAAALRVYGLDPQAISLSKTCLAVNTGDQWVLLDAGMGPVLSSNSRVMENLDSLGLQPEDFAAVIISHLDGDHIGSLTNANGELVYTNARLFIGEEAWRYWLSDQAIQDFPPWHKDRVRHHLLPLEPHATFVKEGQVWPGFRVISAPGHRPGNMAILVQSAGEKLLFLGDSFINPLHFTFPDWHFGGDSDPRAANASRRKLAQLAVEQNAIVHGFHFPFPCIGRVRPDGSTWKWEPIT